MPTARLHRILLLGLVAVGLLQIVTITYTARRFDRLEAAVAEVDRMTLDALETAKEIRSQLRSR